jgi:hypothetical protein
MPLSGAGPNRGFGNPLRAFPDLLNLVEMEVPIRCLA